MRGIKKIAKPILSKEAALQLKLWEELKGKLKNKFSTLNESDLHFEASKNEGAIHKVQMKLVSSKEELTAL